MIFFSIIATASIAVVPLDPASQVDLRCVAALANEISQITDEKDITSYSVGMFYFLGKIDGRHSEIDLSAQLYRLTNQTDFTAQMGRELSRCKIELGQRAKEVSAAAQQLEKAAK